MIIKNKILTHLLALQDAVFINQREFNFPFSTVISERRANFFKKGLQFNLSGIAGKNITEQKRYERDFEELTEQKLVCRHKEKTNNIWVKLTPAGDIYCRKLCAIHTIADSWEFLDVLRELQAGVKDYGGAKWVSEYAIVEAYGHEITETTLANLGQYFLPLMIAGLVVSNATLRRTVFYRLNGEIPAEPPEVVGGKVFTEQKAEPSGDYLWSELKPHTTENEAKEAEDLYFNRVVFYREQLKTAEPENPAGIGVIPLPAAGW